MIYELRTYTLKPGTLPAYLKLNTEVGRVVRGDNYGTLIGGWTSETGTINQYYHLWSYESVSERERLRTALANYPDWTPGYTSQIRPFMVSQENTILHVDPDVGVRPVEGRGHVYELRTYRGHPGQIAAWVRAFKSVLPTREKYSKPVGLWLSEVGFLNSAVHLWAYDDLNHRAKVRAAALADPVWAEYVANSAGLLSQQNSVILNPTPASPLQ